MIIRRRDDMAARKAPTVKEQEKVSEEVKEEKVPTELKYRYQFDTWDEYWSYKGPKG